MAKRKHAAALFEVIHHDKRFPSRRGPAWSWAGPKSWFARRKRAAEAAEAAEAADAGPAGPSWLTRVLNHLPSIPRIGLEMDPERQEIRLCLSYTAAVVTAFTVVVVLGLSFVIGRHGGHRATTPALAEYTTEELRAGPARPEVLDVRGGNSSAETPMALASQTVPATPAPQSSRPASATPAPAAAQSQAVRPSQWTEPRGPATLMVSDSKRTVGLNYVVIQSYHPQQKDIAEAAVQTLNQAGVLCTIEKIPYAPEWLSVVGVTGFDRIRDSAEYEGYVARIKQISDKFAGTSKFKRFDPKPYKWKDLKNGEAVKQ